MRNSTFVNKINHFPLKKEQITPVQNKTIQYNYDSQISEKDKKQNLEPEIRKKPLPRKSYYYPVTHENPKSYNLSEKE